MRVDQGDLGLRGHPTANADSGHTSQYVCTAVPVLDITKDSGGAPEDACPWLHCGARRDHVTTVGAAKRDEELAVQALALAASFDSNARYLKQRIV